ncbi:MAG TPA: phospholipase D-like domain-containing protein [Ktedonobacterales bacterium]|nr:phospholipase D-like domain-containing protein [Ktedonobacterales bacterium]
MSLKRVALIALAGYGALQMATIAVLSAIALRHNKQLKHAHFPHLDLPEVYVEDNQLKIYSYGAHLFEAMLEAIASAQEHIFIESYIWKADAVGEQFKRALIEKARAGVKVYVIFDEFGNLVVPESFKEFPPEIHLLRFTPINRVWHVADPRRYALDHRKTLVVDGRIAFLGGYNIGTLYAEHWRDTHLRITGSKAFDVADSFCDFWNAHAPRSRRMHMYFPLRFDPTIELHDNNALRLTFPIRDMYISAINRAQKHILLTNAYFIPDHVLLESLEDAARRGVAVHVLVPWTSNHILADWAARGYFQRCLQAGIHIWGYRGAMIHAKTCTVDDEWSTIGTANLDRLSAVGNYELNAEIYSKNVARQMRELFEYDQQNAIELTAERWARRPWYVKLSEWALAPLRMAL